MPTLIIPNALELYKQSNNVNSSNEITANIIYQFRFLWLLEPGDIIILPALPSNEFLNYLTNLKQINLNSIHIVTNTTGKNYELIEELRMLINDPAIWSLYACYMNQEILHLAAKINIPIAPTWKDIIVKDEVRHFNSKVFFRQLATQHKLPIAAGNVCQSIHEFIKALRLHLPKSGQVIIKQPYNGGGKGNVGITLNSVTTFAGVSEFYVINKTNSLESIAHDIWHRYTNLFQHQLVVEVYYPNAGSFTCMLWIPPSGSPELLNYSEIRMETTWIGVQIPAHSLSKDQAHQLITISKYLANVLQTKYYSGYMCCDAILTIDNKLIITEINVRAGAEINAHSLAAHILGPDYFQKTTILTRKGVSISSFDYIYQLLKENGMLLDAQNKTGVAILNIAEDFSKEFEYLIAAPDLDGAYAMETKLLRLICIPDGASGIIPDVPSGLHLRCQ